MGGRLCTLRQSCFAKLPDDDTDEDVWRDAREHSTVDFLKPTSVKSEDKGMDIWKDEKLTTLEQWMLSSPCINQDSMDVNSRMQQICRQSAKVSPASYECVYLTPRESFSIDCSPTPRRSQSGKRVSFKLPEDADIHFIYCPDDEKEEQGMGVSV